MLIYSHQCATYMDIYAYHEHNAWIYACYILHAISIILILCVCIINVDVCTYVLYGFVIDFKYTYMCALHIYMFIALYMHVIYVLYIT